MLIKVVGTGFVLIFSFSLKLLLSLLSRKKKKQRPLFPFFSGETNFPARWPVVAPPRRSFKTQPNSKKISVLNILFLALCESELRFLKTNSRKPRSNKEKSKKSELKTLPFDLLRSVYSSPVRSFLFRFVLPCFGSDCVAFGSDLCCCGSDLCWLLLLLLSKVFEVMVLLGFSMNL
ncbi:hypothetical protein MtrunA17_Chr7g0220101 [Medicago truncatula]|uniref:Transmembrane protein n=1 Tax=Medicago truncatula TaxID=3880 RepID=A0A396GTL1_MEDTR|nr:hypothetical protein MtrunA17_Chr7g0220081 [Medicago truncatula]RHN44501.1 hypothetical protein MtrunA17_Chr7g0220101 [Medicago truncatula]